MNNGWIKLHRNILKWEWYQKSEVVHLFLHLLLLANHEENKWQGLTINRGQCATGRKSLSVALYMSEQKIRTNLNKLKSTNEITIKSTNKFSIITIVKWEQYQAKEDKATSKITKTLTNKQPTDNQQITTNKNDKNVKKDTPPKISFLLLEVFKEITGLTTPDGDYQMDNLFPAKQLAKKITEKIKETGKITDIKNENIIDGFKMLLNAMDDFNQKRATSIGYINRNFNKLFNLIKK